MPHAEKGRVAWKYDENKTRKVHEKNDFLFILFIFYFSDFSAFILNLWFTDFEFQNIFTANK